MQADIDDMREFLAEGELEPWLSPIERTLMNRALGQWHAIDIKEKSWTVEYLTALFWALNWIDVMPPVEQLSGIEAIGLFGRVEQGPEVVRMARLRPLDELERMERYLEAIRLRLQTPDDFEGIAWLAGKAAGFGGPVADGDLALAGKAVRVAGSQMRTDATSVSQERHRALYWVLRFELDMDAQAPDPMAEE